MHPGHQIEVPDPSGSRRGEEDAVVRLSVVVPITTLDHTVLASRLYLASLREVHEIIFVLPSDHSGKPPYPVPNSKMVVISAPMGRASQMNAGAAAAMGSHLLFLHCDTQVAPEAVAALACSLAAQPDRALAFSLRFASRRRSLGFWSWAAGLRDRVTALPLGDQGLAVRRRTFRELGGFPDEPLFEDVVMTQMLRRTCGLDVIPQEAWTSARRFKKHGVLRTQLKNAGLMLLFHLGFSPRTLVRSYYGPEYLARWLDASSGRRSSPSATGRGSMRLLRWLGLSSIMLALLLTAGNIQAMEHSHALLDSVLQQFVHAGQVDYAGLKVQAEDPGSAFSRYLDQLAEFAPESEAEWTRQQRLAYWINAYNAYTLKLIVDNYPLSPRWYMDVLPFLSYWMPRNSILQIPGRWDSVAFPTVRGPRTLDAMEHEILRPEFQDPRVHFAIVCASVGCPRLRSHAFHPASVDFELDAATEEFVNTPGKVNWDPEDGSLRVSKIFAWFRGDFSTPTPAGRRRLSAETADKYGRDAGVTRWLAAYGSPELAGRLEVGPFRLTHLPYDWELNEMQGMSGLPLAVNAANAGQL